MPPRTGDGVVAPVDDWLQTEVGVEYDEAAKVEELGLLALVSSVVLKATALMQACEGPPEEIPVEEPGLEVWGFA